MLILSNPWMLLLVVLIPPMVYFYYFLNKRIQSSIRFSNQNLVGENRPSLKVRLSKKIIFLRVLALLCLVLAMARPQSTYEKTNTYVEGIDIVLAVDVSSSMRAMDFEIGGKRVDRLEVVKNVVKDFIAKRPNDRIGMVAFAALSYTVCPLTLDHDWLDKNIDRVNIGMIEDGTAIGSAISASVNRMKNSKAKSKVIILLTDGRNNAGRISPLVAAEAAATFGDKIYTIGAGTRGLAPYPVKDMFGNTVLRPVEIEIDEKLLKEVADATGGSYFRATDTNSLKNIYEEIDKLEKVSIEETGYNIYKELFQYLVFLGLFILICEVVLSNSILRRIP